MATSHIAAVAIFLVLWAIYVAESFLIVRNIALHRLLGCHPQPSPCTPPVVSAGVPCIWTFLASLAYLQAGVATFSDFFV